MTNEQVLALKLMAEHGPNQTGSDKAIAALANEVIRLREALRQLVDWREWPELTGALTYAAVHGFEVARERAAEADRIWKHACDVLGAK